MRVQELRFAADHLDLALPGEHRQTAREPADDPALPAEQFGAIDARLAEFDTRRTHRFGVLDHLAACSNALEGMQPTFRHTPPSWGRRSISVTRSPRSAARNAAV